MQRFKNILVAVDISAGDELVWDELVPPSQEAVEQAIWLAGLSSAKLTFFYVLDVSERARILIEQDEDLSSNVLGHAQSVLAKLVERAEQNGVTAESDVEFGESWVQIIRRVLRCGHDLVLAGTRHHSHLASMLLGSSGTKLLRKCPCAVWITQPRPQRAHQSIVAAIDFSPVCDVVVDLAASMAQLDHATLHIAHALTFSDEPLMRRARMGEDTVAAYREDVEAAAMASMESVLDRPAVRELQAPPVTHAVEGHPQDVILKVAEETKAELLVMGTVVRSGISGIFVGNTTERLLPMLSCSLLAVKPEGFVSPIHL